MAYEKVKLVIALMTGEIYMARISEKGIMDTRNRRVATDDVLNATAEWFMANKKSSLTWKGYGTLKWIPESESDE